MKKHPDCVDECLVAAARGPLRTCTDRCAYADDDTRPLVGAKETAATQKASGVDTMDRSALGEAPRPEGSPSGALRQPIAPAAANIAENDEFIPCPFCGEWMQANEYANRRELMKNARKAIKKATGE